MKIQEFADGYCLTYKEIDYKYQGKSESVVTMISERVKQPLNGWSKKQLKDLLVLKTLKEPKKWSGSRLWVCLWSICLKEQQK